MPESGEDGLQEPPVSALPPPPAKARNSNVHLGITSNTSRNRDAGTSLVTGSSLSGLVIDT